MESLIAPFLIGIPVGAAFTALGSFDSKIKGLTITRSLITLLLSVYALFLVVENPTESAFYFAFDYLPHLGLSFSLGLNGLSVTLIFLTSLLTFSVVTGVLGNTSNLSKGMVFNIFLLQAFLIGVFSAQDMISFYIFWEATLIPMYFLIGIWGGKDRVKANLVFFIFTMVGSLLLLVGVIYLGLEGAHLSGDPAKVFVSDFKTLSELLSNQSIPSTIFWFIFIGFGIKAAIFPLHAWLPKTYTEAPYSALVLLSGAMAKMGTYGMIVFGYYFLQNSLVQFSAWLGFFATVGIIYAAWIAATRQSIKEIIAFSSMSHMGFIILGIVSGTIQGLTGSSIQMLNHGISTGALFILLFYLSNRSDKMDQLSGVATSAPVLATLFIVASLSSIGLPGLNGFIGEFQILLGSFKSYTVPVIFTVIATIGVILAAVYMLNPIKKIFFGNKTSSITDVSFKEFIAVLPLIILMVWIGFAPNMFLEIIQSATNILLK